MPARPHIARNHFRGALVVYTVVSRGRVLGTTELEYVRWRERFRGGNFSPAADAASLMEIAVGVSPACFTLSKKLGHADREPDWRSPVIVAGASRVEATTEYADLASACDREGAMELELRGPDGALIETEWIALQDTELLLSLAAGDVSEPEWSDEPWNREFDSPLTEMPDLDDDDLMAEPGLWDEEFDVEWSDEPEHSAPRYQIFVGLVDDAAVP
jgi:hypothetical protein